MNHTFNQRGSESAPPMYLTSIERARREPLRFEFAGSGGEYFRIWIVNLVLSVLTLGIYSAWAKVRREQYFHRNTLLAGSGFDYHGQPKAILKGRAFAFALAVVLSLTQNVNLFVYLVCVLLMMPVVPWLWLRSLKFRAANTSYRGVRFYHHGTYPQACMALLGHGFLTLLGGIWLPMWVRAIKTFQLDNLFFGNARWQSRPETGGFWSAFIRAGLLGVGGVVLLVIIFKSTVLSSLSMDAAREMPLILGFLPLFLLLVIRLLVAPFLSVSLTNHVWNATSVDGKYFVSQQAFGSFFWVVASNWVLIVLTLGLYWPWAKVREAAYLLRHLSLEAIDLDEFEGMVEQERSAVGAEVAEAFELDFAF